MTFIGGCRILNIDNNDRFSEFFTVEEMAEYLRIGRSKAYALCKDDDFPKITIGKNIRIPRESLNNWLLMKINQK